MNRLTMFCLAMSAAVFLAGFMSGCGGSGGGSSQQGTSVVGQGEHAQTPGDSKP